MKKNQFKISANIFACSFIVGLLLMNITGKETNSTVSKMDKMGNYLLQGNVFTENDISYIDDGTGSIQASGCRNCNGYGTIHVKKQANGYTANRFKPIKRVANYLLILNRKKSLVGFSVFTENGWKRVKYLPDNASQVTQVNGEWIAK